MTYSENKNYRCAIKQCHNLGLIPFYMGEVDGVMILFYWYCKKHIQQYFHPDGCSYWRLG